MIDRCTITDPPQYETRYELDDTAEALGDEFELSVEDKAKIDRAARWGRDMILAARAGSREALADLQHKMHITVYQVMR